MPHTGDAPSLAQNKTFRLVLSLAVVAALVIVIILVIYNVVEKEWKQSAQEIHQKTVIVWSKWKEVVLTDEWSEPYETPTKRDRIVPPPGGKVEVLYENGAYQELKGDQTNQTDQMYRAIEIKNDGSFRLKGPSGMKAEIWTGTPVQQLTI